MLDVLSKVQLCESIAMNVEHPLTGTPEENGPGEVTQGLGKCHCPRVGAGVHYISEERPWVPGKG